MGGRNTVTEETVLERLKEAFPSEYTDLTIAILTIDFGLVKEP